MPHRNSGWRTGVWLLLVGAMVVPGVLGHAQWILLPAENFGQVIVGTSRTVDYVFTNEFTERATINTVEFGSAFFQQEPPFFLGGLVLPTTLAPRAQFRFTIRFSPTAAQTYRAWVRMDVTLERSGRIHYEIPLVGQGVTAPGTTPGTIPGTLTLHPMQDAKIWQVRPTANFGTGTDLAVAPQHSGFVLNDESRTLIQFDLSRLPAGAGIVRATLRLCVWEYHGDPMLVLLYQITQPWSENTVTWSSHAQSYHTLAARTTISPPAPMGTWVEWDVTSDVRNALLTGSPHHGWMLMAGAGAYRLATSAKFYSREGGVSMFGWPPEDSRPQLVVTTGPVAPVGPPVIDQTMARDVQTTSPYDPVGRTTIFSTGDRKAISWLKLGPIYGTCRVTWEWYNPRGERYHTDNFLIPHPRTGGHTHWEWYAVWSEIYIRGTIVARMPGQWEVRIYVDGNYVLSQHFTITR